jgi:16S rRNA (adenine1518-N6/adenine1519-N6)-dimethyltransferase
MVDRGGAPGPSIVLRSRGLRARKQLGQNFLRDSSFLPRILDAGDVHPEDWVLEIGAGTGVLTAALLERGARVTAIELDDSLFGLLREQFKGVDTVRLWHGNALHFDPCVEMLDRYKLIGNIPYYITGPILRHYLEILCRPTVMVLMVQREVADRIVAGPGAMSLLALSVQYYADPSIATRVPAGAFYPRPKVDSAVIRLVPHARIPEPALTEAFFTVARAGFSTRRKQLVNALANGLPLSREGASLLLRAAGIDERRRAEQLSIAEWERLALAWKETVT